MYRHMCKHMYMHVRIAVLVYWRVFRVYMLFIYIFIYIYTYTIRCTYIQISACELMHAVNSFLFFVLTSERGIVLVVVC